MSKDREKGKAKSKYSTKDLYKDDYDRKDQGGAKRTKIIDTSDFEDVEWFQIQEGKNKIDIIPYVITTDNHPQGREKGKIDYKLDIWVHRYVGEEEADVVCLRNTFNKPCPICEEIKKMIASQEYSYKDEEIKKLQPKHREIYNVIDLLEDKPKVKLFDMNHFEFQKEIIEEAESSGDGEFITFAELDDGMSIKFRGNERDGKEFKGSMKPKGFSFVERDEPYDESILDDVYPLDAMLIVPTYDEVKAILFGAALDDDDDDEPVSKKKTKAATKEDDDDDDEPAPRKKSKHTDPEPEEDDDEPEEKPAKKRTRPVKEEDDDEPEEEDEKPAKKAAGKGKGKCPHGGKYGKDCDELDECKSCAEWDECSDATGV